MSRLHIGGLSAAIALAISSATMAQAAECPNNPGALGTSRVMSVKPSEFPLIGKLNYPETLRLADREVVLTFDDGPSAPYTATILDILTAECVKATFFMTGNEVADAPDLLRRALNEGHNVGTHMFANENLNESPFDKSKADIDKGITTAVDAAGGRELISPFFRAPDLEISKQAERYVTSQGLMVWSADVEAQDENEPTEDQFVEKIIAGLEEQGRGILLLHDSQPVTARALRQLIGELKAHKFKIVHVTAPKRTVTTGSAK